MLILMKTVLVVVLILSDAIVHVIAQVALATSKLCCDSHQQIQQTSESLQQHNMNPHS
jgi:hypothetical protein